MKCCQDDSDDTDSLWINLGMYLLYGLAWGVVCFLALISAYWWVFA